MTLEIFRSDLSTHGSRQSKRTMTTMTIEIAVTQHLAHQSVPFLHHDLAHAGGELTMTFLRLWLHRRKYSAVHACRMNPQRSGTNAKARSSNHHGHHRDVEVFRQHESSWTKSVHGAIAAATAFGKNQNTNARIRQHRRGALLKIFRGQCVTVVQSRRPRCDAQWKCAKNPGLCQQGANPRKATSSQNIQHAFMIRDHDASIF